MKVGDTLTVKSRKPVFSKILIRDKGYEYYDIQLEIQAVIDNCLIVSEKDEKNLQLMLKTTWLDLIDNPVNWRD